MIEIDDNIKQVLQSRIQRIDDDSFTKNIIAIHLANNQENRYKPFINFLPFIIGLSSLIFTVGMVYAVRQNYGWIIEIGITEDHGVILITLSFLFLMHKLLEEITVRKTVYSSLVEQ
jgi:hypothetical protein